MMASTVTRLLRTLVLGAGLLAGFCAQADDPRYEFALIGDTPYSAIDRAQLPRMIEAMGREKFAFIIHDGDFKDGASGCTDALFADRLAIFNASAHPFVYVPGDNEWTDCHRLTAGSYDPVERLHKLREMFFAKPQTLGKKRFPLETQAGTDPAHAVYREHVRWVRGPVLYVALNVPGSENNIGRAATPSAEFLARRAAVAAWIKSGFDYAREHKLRGIVLVMQADPDFVAHAMGKASAGYRDLLAQLVEETNAFPGRVLLVHGDSHNLTIDQPLRGKGGAVLENFTRIETYGYPFAGWVTVGVDAADPKLFRITPHPWQAVPQAAP